MESYNVQAVLSAIDRGFTSSVGAAEKSLGGLQSSAEKSVASIGKIAAGIGVFKAVSAAGQFVTNTISGLKTELEQGSATWKTFNGNMENIGKGKDEIAAVKKELQDFATKTIYSASDMATTYSQLEAVGIKSSNELVRGFGGIAAAAENPQQAMKTLSQQATQMAAKPMVQWQDFKLMLEQTPAGIAAVAKEMGMSTAEMVQGVQDGTIATQDFFNAVTKVGTNDTFSKMAMQYKNVGQAMDGLYETVTGKLQPAYDKFSQFAIDGISKLTDYIGELNIDKFTEGLNSTEDIINRILPLAKNLGAVLGAGLLISGSSPFLEKMPGIFSGIASKGKEAADSVGGIVDKAKGLGKNVNITNFAKGFEKARSKLSGFRIGMIEMDDIFAGLDKGMLKAGVGVINLEEKFPKLTKAAKVAGKGFGGISTGLQKATSVGTTVLGGFMSSIGSIVSIALKMIAPAAIIGVVLAGLGVAMTQFGDQINSFIEQVATKGPEVISKFADGIISKLPELISLGAEMVTNLLNALAANIPTILSKGTELITTLVQGVSDALPKMIPAALNVITALLNGIISNAPKLLMAGMNLLLSLVQGIVSNLPLITQSAQSIIMNFVTMVVQYLPQIITIGFQILMSLVNGIMQMLPALFPVAVQAIVTLINGLVSMLPTIIEMALTLIQTLLDGLVANLPMILEGAVQIIQALIQGLVSALPQIIVMGIQIIFMLVNSILQMLPDILAAGWEIVKSLALGIIQAIPNVLKGAWDGIKNGFSNLWDTITGKSKETSTAVSTDMQTASTGMQTSIDALASGTATSISGMSTNVSGITNNLSSNIIGSFGTMATESGAYASSLEGNVTNATNSLSSLGSIDIESLQSNALSSFGSMNSDGSSMMESLSSSVTSSSSEASSGATSNYQDMAKGVNASLNQVNTDASGAFTNLNATVKSGTTEMSNTIKANFSTIQSQIKSSMTTIVSTVNSGMGQAVSVARSQGSAMVNVFNSLHGAMYSAGSYAMQGFSNGISAGAGSAIAAANSVANQVASTINSALKIHSPSRVTEESGEYTTEGLEVGMLNRLRNLANTAKTMAQTITDNLVAKADFSSNLVAVGDFSGFSSATEMNLNENSNRPILLTVISEIDGREVSRATVKTDVKEAEKYQRIRKLVKGE